MQTRELYPGRWLERRTRRRRSVRLGDEGVRGPAPTRPASLQIPCYLQERVAGAATAQPKRDAVDGRVRIRVRSRSYDYGACRLPAVCRSALTDRPCPRMPPACPNANGNGVPG